MAYFLPLVFPIFFFSYWIGGGFGGEFLEKTFSFRVIFFLGLLSLGKGAFSNLFFSGQKFYFFYQVFFFLGAGNFFFGFFFLV